MKILSRLFRTEVEPQLLALQDATFSSSLHEAFNKPAKTMSRYCILASHFAIYRHAQKPAVAKAFDQQVAAYLKQRAFTLFVAEYDRKVWLEMRRIYNAAWYASQSWILDENEALIRKFIESEMYAAEVPGKLKIPEVMNRLGEVKEKYLAGVPLTEA